MAYLGNTIVNGTLKVINNLNTNYTISNGMELTNQLVIRAANTYGNYNEGIRITKAPNNWACINIGGNVGTVNGAPSTNGGWWLAQNPSNQFMITNQTSDVSTSSIWINTDKKVTMNGACNVVGSLTQNGTAVSLSTHTHNYAGSASAGGPTNTINLPRVTESCNHLPGKNIALFREYNSSSANLPSAIWYHIIEMEGADTNYATQIALGMTGDGAYYRRYASGSWGAWKSLINTNTTYSANNGVGLSGTTFYNSGVRSIATGSSNGTISVNTNGTAADVAVKGLGTAAYTASTAYAASSHTHNYAGSSSAGGAANSLSGFTTGWSNSGEHNANNMASNGIWYYTSNGPATSLGASTNDGALYSQAYSTSWVGQIAQDYRNGNLFIRGKNSGTWQSWREVVSKDASRNLILAGTSGTTYIQLPSGIKLY